MMLDFAYLPIVAIGRLVMFVASSVFWTWVLWVFFLAVMHLREARDAGKIPRFAYPPAMATLFVGYLLDFAVNVVVLTIVMLELPHETTVTTRLKRHKDDGNWRGRIARWVAAQLLDPFDPDGKHV